MSAVLTEFVADVPLADSGAAAPPLRLDVRAAQDRAAVLVIWRNLEAEIGHARITSSALWIETWLTHYGSHIPHQFLIGYRGPRAVGVCLVTESVQRYLGVISVRTQHIGTAGEPEADSVCVEFNSLLARPTDRAEFAVQIQRHLERASRVDAIAWDGFEPEELPDGLMDAANSQAIVRPTCYYDLDGVRDDGVEPITRLGDSTRKNIRQNMRDLGQVDIDWSETSAQIDESYAELVALHQARWQAAGKPGSFASDAFRNFHHDLLHRLVPLGRAAIVRVRAGRQTIGCTLLHVDQNRALVYQIGWATGTRAKSPGLVNDYNCILACLRRGYAAYDFMAGESVHKRRMTTHQGRLVWATCQVSPWKAALLEQLRTAKQWLRSRQNTEGGAA